MNENFFDDWPGLFEALLDFGDMDNFTIIPDPHFDGVFLFRGEFMSNRAYGLFIWDSNRKIFIEEPSDLDDYGFKSIAEVYKKYPGLRPIKRGK